MTTPMVDAKDRLIVALDFPAAAPARELLERLDGSCRWVKVGLELYFAEGRAFVEELRGLGYEVFLDLKVHDIPNTAAGAVRSAAQAGASLLTVHAAGGAAMLEAAVAAAAGSVRLLAVTVLTSMDRAELAAVGIAASPEEQVLRLARLAQAAGIQGMVCSAEEVAAVRAMLGYGVELVVPGIRPMGAEVGDQRRVAAPGEAIRLGASRLVVGRPITLAANPQAVVEAILEDIETASASDPVPFAVATR